MNWNRFVPSRAATTTTKLNCYYVLLTRDYIGDKICYSMDRFVARKDLKETQTHEVNARSSKFSENREADTLVSSFR